MGGRDQIAVLYLEVVDRRDRQIELQGLPRSAIVQRDVDPPSPCPRTAGRALSGPPG